MRRSLLFFRVSKVVTQDLEVVTCHVLGGDISHDFFMTKNAQSPKSIFLETWLKSAKERDLLS